MRLKRVKLQLEIMDLNRKLKLSPDILAQILSANNTVAGK